MGRKLEEITLAFDYEKNVFGNAAEDERTIIGSCEDGTTVKGRARAGALETGVQYRFYGHWTEHPKYGKQFAFQSFSLAVPSGQRGTIAYLQRGPGIGRKRAMAIWDEYGSLSLQAIREKPEEVAEKISGLTPEKCKEAAVYFERLAGLEAVTIELTDLFAGRGFPRKLVEEVIGRWGNDAPRVIRENPYVLMDGFRGVGFTRADRLYLELKLPADAIDRQGYCLWHALHSDKEGHTWRELAFCVAHLNQHISGGEVKLKEAVEWAIAERKIVLKEVAGVTWAAEYGRAAAEEAIANYVHRAELEDKEGLNWPDVSRLERKPCPKCWKNGVRVIVENKPCDECEGSGYQKGPSRHQVEELGKSFGGYIGILAGRPGTGKTFTIASVIKLLRGRRLAVAGPTGKSAVRITESLAKSGVAGIKATTIHTLLKVVSNNGGWEFEHNEDNPLQLDFIFIDEASMIDTPLMASLLAARPSGCHVLFVGDPGQLSPVGHSAPLRDLIAAGLPCGLLTEIQRNSGRIVKACHAIADRAVFEPSASLDLEAGENLLHIERGNPDGQIEQLKALLEKIRSSGKYDVVRDVQILVPVNEKSPLGRIVLNKVLQGFLNPTGQQVDGNKFRVNDKIICTQNGMMPVEVKVKGFKGRTTEEKCYTANGEIAIVEEVFPLYTVARLENPDRLIRIPKGNSYENEDGGEESTGCNWELAYAISTHKSQGSEWPIVIVMIDSFPGAIRLCTKEWIYTALSRGKIMVITIGRKMIAQGMCNKSGLWQRKTFLKESVEELRLQNLTHAWERELAIV